MGDLTKNFNKLEFQCKCRTCGDHEIDSKLISGLQKIRDIAQKPVEITSGYRCEDWNRVQGGASGSYHIRGQAADIKIKGLTSEKIAALAEQVQEFQDGAIITYSGKNWCHVDVRGHRVRIKLL